MYKFKDYGVPFGNIHGGAVVLNYREDPGIADSLNARRAANAKAAATAKKGADTKAKDLKVKEKVFTPDQEMFIDEANSLYDEYQKAQVEAYNATGSYDLPQEKQAEFSKRYLGLLNTAHSSRQDENIYNNLLGELSKADPYSINIEESKKRLEEQYNKPLGERDWTNIIVKNHHLVPVAKKYDKKKTSYDGTGKVRSIYREDKTFNTFLATNKERLDLLADEYGYKNLDDWKNKDLQGLKDLAKEYYLEVNESESNFRNTDGGGGKDVKAQYLTLTPSEDKFQYGVIEKDVDEDGKEIDKFVPKGTFYNAGGVNLSPKLKSIKIGLGKTPLYDPQTGKEYKGNKSGVTTAKPLKVIAVPILKKGIDLSKKLKAYEKYKDLSEEDREKAANIISNYSHVKNLQGRMMNEDDFNDLITIFGPKIVQSLFDKRKMTVYEVDDGKTVFGDYNNAAKENIRSQLLSTGKISNEDINNYFDRIDTDLKYQYYQNTGFDLKNGVDTQKQDKGTIDNGSASNWTVSEEIANLV